jgi:uncharacterized protein (TIGR02246 family)
MNGRTRNLTTSQAVGLQVKFTLLAGKESGDGRCVDNRLLWLGVDTSKEVRVRHSIWRIIPFSAVSLLCLSIDALPQTDGPQVVADGWVKAFNAHDSVAFGRTYTEDADWVNVVGVRVKGREHIQAAHEEAFTTYFKPATITAVSRTVRSVRPDVAVVHINWELRGQVDTTTGEQLPLRRGIITMLAVEQQDGWKIAAGQNSNSTFREQLWAPGSCFEW